MSSITEQIPKSNTLDKRRRQKQDLTESLGLLTVKDTLPPTRPRSFRPSFPASQCDRWVWKPTESQNQNQDMTPEAASCIRILTQAAVRPRSSGRVTQTQRDGRERTPAHRNGGRVTGLNERSGDENPFVWMPPESRVDRQNLRPDTFPALVDAYGGGRPV
jgi:hypothetical protein